VLRAHGGEKPKLVQAVGSGSVPSYGDAVLKDVRVSRIQWKARVDHANQNA
jgi:hypothetical protein